jgi:hypothetical protein
MNPELRPQNDLEAITVALRPWTSGREHLRGPYAEYGTKGNGLFVVQRLIESVDGEILLSSFRGLHTIRPGGTSSIEGGNWPGTVVALEFPLRLPAEWLNLMKPIWRELNAAK